VGKKEQQGGKEAEKDFLTPTRQEKGPKNELPVSQKRGGIKERREVSARLQKHLPEEPEKRRNGRQSANRLTAGESPPVRGEGR